MIRNKKLMSQITDFKGMLYGRCRPTDIDLSMDFNKEVFIFTELKWGGTPLTVGQRIHLMGLVDAITAGGRLAYAVLASHNTHNDMSIHAAEATVKRVYDGTSWMTYDDGPSLHDFISEAHTNYLQSKEEDRV